MKLNKYIFISFIIIGLLTLVELTTNKKRSLTSTQYWIRPLIKTAKQYMSFANLAYCNLDIINSLSCPLCSSILDQSFKVLDVHTAEKSDDKHLFRFVILLSEPHKEFVISFAGPKSSDGSYYGTIYTSGWGKIHGQGVEKAFLKVYNEHIAKPLQNSLKELFKKNKEYSNYKFVFSGHSFGGSLAILAAFDLLHKKILTQNQSLNSPLVYSYGQLRIGNDEFVNKVNSLFKVVRIVKNNDHMTRLPNCIFSKQTGQWRCFKDTYNLMLRYPLYKRYIMHYSGSNGNKQHLTGIQVAYGNNNNNGNVNRGFLQKSEKVEYSRRKKGFYYTTNNPGYKVYSYGSTLTNQGTNSAFGNVYYSQPMGAEVLYSERFRKFQVCSYYKGIPNCERQLPRTFDPSDHAKYYGENVEQC